VAVLEHLDAILAVPGIDLYSIGPNDFAQSLGYPGQLDHPEVVKAKRTQPQWPVHRYCVDSTTSSAPLAPRRWLCRADRCRRGLPHIHLGPSRVRLLALACSVHHPVAG
jgi:hypothetical protein